MQCIRRLQAMPHIFVAEAKIPMVELQSATSAFSSSREYEPATPLVRRFDHVVSPFAEPATLIFLEYDMIEVLRDLYSINPCLFERYEIGARCLRQSRQIDRKRKDIKRHDTNFASTVARNIRTYGMVFPGSVSDLAAWIWASPFRCPAVRLAYEVYHKILRNLTDSGEDSDVADFAHLDCVPYVDVITLDRRMRGYLRQVDGSIGTNYSQKVRCIGDIGTVRSLA